MMFKKISWILILIMIVPSIVGGNKSFPEKVDFFEVDIIGNLYFVNNSEISKYNSEEKLLKTYSNLTFGNISTIDVSDAMNILIYYRDFNKIVMLDNQLSIKNSPIDLMDLGYSEANFVCLSYNNGFWIFDPVGQELLRFNQLLENTDRSGNLTNITSYKLLPSQLIERDNQLILRDDKNGIFVFDRYGGYLKRLPFKNFDDLFVRSNSWQLLRNDTSFMFNPITLAMDTIPMPYTNVKEFRLNDDFYYLNFRNNSFVKRKL